ncbi:uncharacterized protein LOC143369570 isoform X2 [Andrena cerasifolii]|uniref:uncharacterized protein LOC143369570 isoform X2 n=1 Tax=Andrena cerasifolii TaxID=2819439 RepID=UPI0040382586
MGNVAHNYTVPRLDKSRRASPSNDITAASRSRSSIEGATGKDPPKQRVNSIRAVSVTSTLTSSAEESRHHPSRNDWKSKIADDKAKDRNGNPFEWNGARWSKAGQAYGPRFPSSSRVVHGIQDGGVLYYHRGRDWFRLGARCVARISNRTAAEAASRGRCASSRRARGRRDNGRRSILKRGGRQPRPREQLLRRRRAANQQLVAVVAEEPSRKQNADGPPSSVQSSRKRRVGIVENQYVAESDGGSSSVCELVRGLERLFGDRENGNVVAAMRSKKQQSAEEEAAVDPIEANETYDEFDTVRMPVVRSLSKSPQSDEGIETDPERRRGPVARCWSLDSAAASDEDASLTTHQLKRHKLRVTRCCSSDSAVLSDEDQIKGWDNSNMVEGSESEHNEGRPRYWRTPSVVVSDYSDYSYLDEKLERNDLDLEKYDGTSGTPSQASSCSCLDCDEIRESLDNQFLQVCRSRRHSDSCCLCLDSMNAAATRTFNEAGTRRNSCLDTTNSYYSKLDSQFLQYSQDNSADVQEKTKVELLDIPPARKISDCSTSSLSGDESDITELQQVKPSRITNGPLRRSIETLYRLPPGTRGVSGREAESSGDQGGRRSV